MRARIIILALIHTLIFPPLYSVAAQRGGQRNRSITVSPRRASQRATTPSSNRGVPAPEEVLGFRPGADRMLASWASVVDYFRELARASDRVRVEELGRTTMNAPFVLATFSAPENLDRKSVV